jgi:hypothetical protein
MRSLAPAVLAIALVAGFTARAIQAQPVPAPSAEPAPVQSPSPPPAAPTAAPLPVPSPTAPPTAAPTAAPASPYRYVVTPPAPAPGMPSILEIDMLDVVLHPGGAYSVRVKTSLDVTTLNVTTMGTTYGMQAAAPGLFATDGQVPSMIPFFLLNRGYAVTVTAMTADKKSTSVTVNLRLEK